MYPLTNINLWAEQTLNVKGRDLALRMAERDRRALMGVPVKVSAFATTRRHVLAKSIVARVERVDVEESDDFIDLIIRVRFTRSVAGEFAGTIFGRTYAIK